MQRRSTWDESTIMWNYQRNYDACYSKEWINAHQSSLPASSQATLPLVVLLFTSSLWVKLNCETESEIDVLSAFESQSATRLESENRSKLKEELCLHVLSCPSSWSSACLVRLAEIDMWAFVISQGGNNVRLTPRTQAILPYRQSRG